MAVRDGKFEIASDIEGYKELTIDEPTDSPHPRPIGNAPPASW